MQDYLLSITPLVPRHSVTLNTCDPRHFAKIGDVANEADLKLTWHNLVPYVISQKR